MTDVLTRLAGAEDAGAIADIHADARLAVYRTLDPAALKAEPSIGRLVMGWHSRLSEPDEPSFTLIAERELEPVGFCAIAAPSFDSKPGTGVGEVSELLVAPEAWRSGVGSTLLETALARLAMHGWQEVTTWVFATNTAALSFFSRFGLHPDGSVARHDLADVSRIRLRVEL